MGDLTRIDQAQAIEVTDGISQTAVIATALPGTSDAGLVIRDAAQGQATMAASRPVVIASNQSAVPVSGTVTLSSNTVTLSSQTVTLSSQTITAAQSGTWTMSTNADANVAAGTAPAKALLGAIVYNTAVPTLTNGQTVAMQSDVNGNLKIAGTLTTSPSGTQAVSGTVTLSSQTVTLSSQTITLAAGSAAIGTVTTNADANLAAGTAPAKALVVAQVYNTTQPTLTTGQTVAIQSDINGNQKVVLSGTSNVTAAQSGTWTVASNADAPITAGTAPTKALLGAVIYNSAMPTLTTGQTVALQSDVNGDLRVNVNGAPTTTATVNQVTVSSVTTTQLCTSNVARNKLLIFNNGSNFVYIKLGASASATSYSVILYPGGLYESAIPIYSGQIDAIANSATTVLNVTEV